MAGLPDQTAEGIRTNYCRLPDPHEPGGIQLGFFVPSGKAATHVVVFFPGSDFYVHASSGSGIIEVEKDPENYTQRLEVDWNRLIPFMGPQAGAPSPGK
jgi:hypothetical protein